MTVAHRGYRARRSAGDRFRGAWSRDASASASTRRRGGGRPPSPAAAACARGRRRSRPARRPAAITRWHGMTIARRLAPLALPTARAAPGAPMSLASSGVGARLAEGDAQERVPDPPLEGAAGVLEPGGRKARRRPAKYSSSCPRRRANRGLSPGASGRPKRRRSVSSCVSIMRRSGYSSMTSASSVAPATSGRNRRRLQPGEADEEATRAPPPLRRAVPPPACRTPCGSRSGSPSRGRTPPRRASRRAQRDERVAEPARPAVGLERHAMCLLEPAPHGRRVQALGAQAGVGDARRRVGLDARDEARRPLGCAGLRVERPAPPAGAKASHQRLARRRVERDVLRLRAARRALTGGRRCRWWSRRRRRARHRTGRARAAP